MIIVACMRSVHAYKIKIRSEVRELHANFTMFLIDLESGERKSEGAVAAVNPTGVSLIRSANSVVSPARPSKQTSTSLCSGTSGLRSFCSNPRAPSR